MGHCPTFPALVSRKGTVWKFVQWTPPMCCPSDQTKCCRIGKRALTTVAQIAGDVVADKNVKKAAKRRARAAGRDLMQSNLNTPPPPGKNDDSEHNCFRNNSMVFVHRQSYEW